MSFYTNNYNEVPKSKKDSPILKLTTVEACHLYITRQNKRIVKMQNQKAKARAGGMSEGYKVKVCAAFMLEFVQSKNVDDAVMKDFNLQEMFTWLMRKLPEDDEL